MMIGVLVVLLTLNTDPLTRPVANLSESSRVTNAAGQDSQLEPSAEHVEGQSTSDWRPGPAPRSVCNPTIYYCLGYGSTQQQACDNAALCAIDNDACWYAPSCSSCLKINTSPPTYECSRAYKRD